MKVEFNREIEFLKKIRPASNARNEKKTSLSKIKTLVESLINRMDHVKNSLRARQPERGIGLPNKNH